MHHKDPRVKERKCSLPSGHPLCDPPKAITNRLCYVSHHLRYMDNGAIVNSDLNPQIQSRAKAKHNNEACQLRPLSLSYLNYESYFA